MPTDRTAMLDRVRDVLRDDLGARLLRSDTADTPTGFLITSIYAHRAGQIIVRHQHERREHTREERGIPATTYDCTAFDVFVPVTPSNRVDATIDALIEWSRRQ